MIPLTNHDSSEGEQWGRDQIYPDILSYTHHQKGAPGPHVKNPHRLGPRDLPNEKKMAMERDGYG